MARTKPVFRMPPDTRALYAAQFRGRTVAVVHSPLRNENLERTYVAELLSVGHVFGGPDNYVITLRATDGNHAIDDVLPLSQVRSIALHEED